MGTAVAKSDARSKNRKRTFRLRESRIPFSETKMILLILFNLSNPVSLTAGETQRLSLSIAFIGK